MSDQSWSFSKHRFSSGSFSYSYKSDSTAATSTVDSNSKPDYYHNREKLEFNFEPIAEEITVSNTGSDDRSNSASRISEDLELGRTRFAKFIDLKSLKIDPEKESFVDNPDVQKLHHENNEVVKNSVASEVQNERSRAGAFCISKEELCSKPINRSMNSLNSLDRVLKYASEESKSPESHCQIDFNPAESYSTAWDISHNSSILERNISQTVQIKKYNGPLSKDFSNSADLLELLQLFRKSSSCKSSEKIILRKSHSSSNLITEEINKSSLPCKLYKCDYKLYVDGKEYEKSVIQDPPRKNSGLKLDRRNSIYIKKVYNLRECQAYAHVSQVFQASRKEHIIDYNRLQERISSDPFIILASKNTLTSKEHLHNQDFTNIQWICIQKLIDEITSLPKDDIIFEEKRVKMRRTLIMTYDIAISSFELFEYIMRRFFIPTPACLSTKEASFFDESVKQPAQLRVLELLLYWMRERETDFLENLALRQLAMAYVKFAACVSSDYINERLKEIKHFLDPSLERERAFSQNKTIDVLDRSIMNLLVKPKLCQRWYINDSKSFRLSSATKTLFDFSPKEIAAQMTLIDSALHKDIRPWHMPYNLRNRFESNSFHELSNKEGHHHDDDNPYRRLIQQTNFRTFFFVYLIIAQKTDQRKRCVASRLLEIAEECLRLQNYQGFSCIIGALTNMAITSQKIDWNQMPPPAQKRKKLYENIYGRTRELRSRIKDSVPPLVPCLMIVSLDLEKIMTVPVNLDESKRLVNFRSMEEIVSATEKFFSSQRSDFNFNHQPIQKLLEYFQVDVLRLMILLSSDLNLGKIQTQLQALALKPINK